jgi:hypothetical protein
MKGVSECTVLTIALSGPAGAWASTELGRLNAEMNGWSRLSVAPFSFARAGPVSSLRRAQERKMGTVEPHLHHRTAHAIINDPSALSHLNPGRWPALQANLVKLCGQVAQAVFNAPTNDKSGTADQLIAAVPMEGLDDKTCSALVHAGKQYAEAVLRRYEPCVHRVAQSLMEKPVMDEGTFVRTLLGS